MPTFLSAKRKTLGSITKTWLDLVLQYMICQTLLRNSRFHPNSINQFCLLIIFFYAYRACWRRRVTEVKKKRTLSSYRERHMTNTNCPKEAYSKYIIDVTEESWISSGILKRGWNFIIKFGLLKMLCARFTDKTFLFRQEPLFLARWGWKFFVFRLFEP